MKLKLPKKIKISLPLVFAVLVALVLATEVLVLYKYLYLNLAAPAPADLTQVKSGVNETGYDGMKTWFSQKKSFALPTSTPPAAGRENPFEEYK